MVDSEVKALARLLEQGSRFIHALGYAESLYPAQWSALRYFARAAPEQCTAAALARFQGLAPGPVTRTVRTLIDKGLLASGQASGRGGAKRLTLSAAGRDVLGRDPLMTVETALAHVDGAGRRALATALQHVLRHLQVGDAEGGGAPLSGRATRRPEERARRTASRTPARRPRPPRA